MPDGDINWLFSEVFRRLALVLENTKNHKQREQIQLVIEGVAAIKKGYYRQIEQLRAESNIPKNEGQSRKLPTDLRGGGVMKS